MTKPTCGLLPWISRFASRRRRNKPRRPVLEVHELEPRTVPSNSPGLPADPFLEANGITIRNGHGTGNAVLLQGTNLGGWLISENWMTPRDSSGQLQDDYSERQTLISRFGTTEANNLIATYQQSWITTQDLDNIKGLGMNVVRVPFYYLDLVNPDGSWRSDAITEMDWVVNNCAARGIYVLLDFHGVPGTQVANNQDTGQVSSTAAYWTSTSDQQLTLSIWQGIASRYASNSWVAGYDLINEPSGAPSQAALWNAYASLYTGIRSVDPNHMIFMEAAWGDWSLDELPNPSTQGWTNVVYQVHEYAWSNTSDPATIEAGTNWRVQDFKNHLSWNMPYMVGEFNDFSPGSTPAAVWNYTIQQYQQNNISWTNWSYKTSLGAGNSWGIYNSVASHPPVPNLQTDSAAIIQSDWSQWTTARASQVNGWLQSALDVNVRGEFGDTDIGSPGLPGSSAYDPTTGQWTVQGGGSDIAGTSDQFNFSSQAITGDQTIVAEVTGVANTDPGAKAGLMVRAGTAANAAYAFVFVTPGHGVGFEYRTVTGSSMASAGYVTTITAPAWVKLVRSVNSFTAFYSTDGVTWTQVGGAHAIAMSATGQAGLAVTAHNNGLLNAATFKSVNVLPPNWSDADVGTPGLPGSAAFDGQTWTVTGGGSDIAGTSDQFNFVSQGFTGDGSITAQVANQENTNSWAKAGVMIRASADPAAANVGVFATPGNGVTFQVRGTAGGSTTSITVAGLSAPVWVRLLRAGAVFTAYYSTNGTTWTQVGSSQTVTAMPTSALAGLAVAAHDNAALNTVTFTGVAITPAPFTQYLVTIQSGSSVTAGTAFTVAIQAADAYGNPVATYSGPSSVTATISPTSTASNFPAAVPLNSHGFGVFLANLSKVGTYTITASSGSFAGSATPVTVIAGPPASLGFGAQPVSTPTGVVLPAVTVRIQDLYDNLVTTDNSDVVALGIATGPGSFTSGSSTSATVHNGVASFANLALVGPGSYTLSAQVPTLYTGPNSTTFAVAPLQVVPGSFAGTPSGFSLQFNAPILVNSTTPVLFGQGFGSSAPAPSVIVTTDPGNLSDTRAIVAGSLVLTPATNTITFVATNTTLQADNGLPLLPDGTYTAVVRSSAGTDGFQAFNSGGGFLDGLGNGTPGSGDYKATFTVNTAAAHEDVVWVPATADGPGQALSAPGMNQVGGGYPVYLNDSTGTVANVQLTFNYDPALLTVTGVRGAGFALLGSSTPGHAVLQYSGPALPAGSPTPIGFLTAQVPSGTTATPMPYRAKDFLHLSNVTLNTGAISVATSDGLHLVAYVGDADGNGSYSSNDAVLITRAALQTDSGFTAYPLVDPVIVADTDGAGYIPPDAALQVNEAGVGLPTANLSIPPIPSGTVFQAMATHAGPSVILPNALPVGASETITTLVNLDDDGDVRPGAGWINLSSQVIIHGRWGRRGSPGHRSSA